MAVEKDGLGKKIKSRQRGWRKTGRASGPWSPEKSVSGGKGPEEARGGEEWVLRFSNIVVISHFSQSDDVEKWGLLMKRKRSMRNLVEKFHLEGEKTEK